MSDVPHDHCGIDCPQCQAASEACKILGGFAEALEKMIEGGVFERLGAEMARRREEAIWKAWMEAK